MPLGGGAPGRDGGEGRRGGHGAVRLGMIALAQPSKIKGGAAAEHESAAGQHSEPHARRDPHRLRSIE